MKKGLTLFVAIIFAMIAVSCGPQAPETVKLGFIGPLTGDYAQYGELMSRAAEIAIAEWNAQGGIGGKTVELIKEDSEGRPEKAVAAMEKLASQDKIWGLIGEVFSGASLAIAPRAEAEKIVMISASATHPGLSTAGNFIFRTVPSDALQAEVFANYVAEVLGYKNVAVLFTKNDYSQTLGDSFSTVFQAAGGTIVASESGQQGDKDFKTQLTTIKNANPEAIFLPNYVAEIAQILEQAAGLGITAKFLSADGFSNPEILSLAGKYAEGVVFSAAPAAPAGTSEAFVMKMKDQFNLDADDFSKNAYDATNILLAGIRSAYDQASDADKAAFSLNRDLIQASVAVTKDHQGVSGMVTFDANGDVVKNIGVNIVQNGAFKATGTYTVVNGELTAVQ